MTQEQLVNLKWIFTGFCQRCKPHKEKWMHPKMVGIELKVTRSKHFFAVYQNNFCIKAGRFSIMEQYLKDLYAKETKEAAEPTA